MTDLFMKQRYGFAATLVMAALLSPTTAAIAADLSALPPAQTQNGVTYVTGGIGQPESTAMESAASQYDLMMTFARNDGAFVSDVQVSISDQQGAPVLDLVSGPILLIDLPDGTYKIQASFAGDSKVRTVTVGAQHQRLAYTWSTTGNN
ncbi:hypothetical protein ThidrDRAFT_2462 [Thiorhodococcus drewsii AZ1]|uniref:Carboxypeptidase regulatory-like domain-containing protein n=1 Tax=Thiorhodococcus drewsii AZ1 TaxID=765913 RepID=G2E2B4_9GAMM|nr:hypothetical protein [Thiorhodococcus drewsii]EGV30830.1 hypothetical protein ThidrDRAFT_2462 [Thiorhodococcus drewsii AZ1]